MPINTPETQAVREAVLEAILAHPEKHDQRRFANQTCCGTTMCIAGWATIVAGGELHPQSFKVNGRSVDPGEVGQEVLGLDVREGCDLFYDLDNASALIRLKHLWGREFYFPSLVTVWHVEPDNGDSHPHPCGDLHWRRHVRHWKVQVHPLQQLRRRALTRCEWCHGRSTKSDPVNMSHQWDREPGRWWLGERGLYHRLCSAAHNAHGSCLCDQPVLDHNGYGQCARCMRQRSWMTPERAATYPTPMLRYLASLDSGERPDRERVAALRGPNV